MIRYPAVPSMIANDQMPSCLPGQKLTRVPNPFILYKKAWGLVNHGGGNGRVVAARAGAMCTKWKAYYDALVKQRKDVYPWYKLVRAPAGPKKPKRAYNLKKKPETGNDHDCYLAQQYLHVPSDFDCNASAVQLTQQQQQQLGRQEHFLPMPAMPVSPQFQHASTSAYNLMRAPATYDIHYDTFADQPYEQQLEPQEQFLPMPVPVSQQFQHESTSSQEQYLMYDRSATYNIYSDAFADHWGRHDMSAASTSQQFQYDASTISQGNIRAPWI